MIRRSVLLSVGIMTAGLLSAQTAQFVTGSTTVSVKADNGFVGWAGMKFTTGATALRVTELGRLKRAGNSRNHTLKLVLAATGADVPGASVTVSLAGGAAGQYRYGALAAPVTLSPATAYYLVSSENLNADSTNYANVTTTAAGVADHAVLSSGQNWVRDIGAKTYGPVNFRYSLISDTTPPTVSVTSPAAGQTVAGTVTVTATATDNVAVAGVTFRVDGTAIGSEDRTAPYSISLNTTSLSDGSHSITAVARDTSNLSRTSSAVTVTVRNTVPDTTPPAVSVTSPAAGQTVSGTVTITAAATDNVAVAGVTFRVDGAPIGSEDRTAPYSVSVNTTSLSNGSHSITAVARDTSNLTGTSSAVTVTVRNTVPDTTPPAVSVTAPAAGQTVSGTVAVTATATDNVAVAGVTFRVDGTAIGAEDTTAPYSMPLNTSTLTNGSHSITAVARDTANLTATSSAVTVTVDNPVPDTTPPTVSVTSPTPGQAVSGTVTITATATDNVSVAGVTFRVDGTAVGAEDTTAPYGVSLDTTTLSNGSHSITAVARDAANLTATSPAVAVTSTNSASSTSGTEFVTGSTTLQVVQSNGFVGWAGMKFTTGSLPLIVTELGRMVLPGNSGNHTLKLVNGTTGLDVPGASLSISLAGATAGQYRYATLAATVTLAANTAYYLVSSETLDVDSTNYANVTTTTAGVANNAVYSSAQNWVMEPGAKTYGPLNLKYTLGSGSSDTTPPAVSVTSPSAGQTVSGTVTIAATATDNVAVAGVTFRVDGTAVGAEDTTAPYSFSLDTTAWSNGSHAITAVARDTANLTTTSSPVTVTVTNLAPDTTPPAVSVTSPSAGQTVSGTVTITATATDNVAVAGVTFRVDGTAIGAEDTTAPYSFSLDTTAWSNGSHSITAVARDTANLTTTSSPVAVTISNGLPSGTEFVTSSTTLQVVQGNGFVGWAGMKFTTGSTPLVVTELGRMVLQGNSGNHTLKLVNGTTGVDVPGASVNISLAGAAGGQYRYAALAGAVTLAANTAYYLVSSETLDVDSTNYANVTTTTAGVANNAVYSSGQSWVMEPGAKAYGPLNFRYTPGSGGSDTTPPTVSVTSPAAGQTISGTVTITATATDNVAVAGVTFRVDGTAVDAEDTAAPYSASLNTAILSNGSHSITAVARDTSSLTTTSTAVAVTVSNGGSSTGTEFVTSSTTLQVVQSNGFVGWAGMKFTTGSTPLVVTELGRMVLQGNSGNHTLKLVNGTTGLDVPGASVNISLAGATVGQYRYAALAGAVTLAANTAYYLVSSETLDVDSTNYANVTTTTAGVANNAVYSSGQSWVMEPGAKAYGPLNFRYTPGSGGSDTTPPTVSITSPAAGQTISGTVTITATATDNVAVAGVTFRVDGTAIGAEDTTAPYSASLNTTSLSNGSHSITAVARDTSNLTTTSPAVAVTVSNGGSSTGTEFVTSSTTLQVIQGNGFVGWAGMKFTTGSTPLVVTELGRMVLQGNSGNHTLKLVNGTTGLDVPGASVAVSLAGATVGQYRYAVLAGAVTLAANTAYYLVSSETLDVDSTNYANVTTTAVGVANNAVYSSGQNWVMEPGAKAYGPLNFRYTPGSGGSDTTPPTVSITSPTAGQTVSGTVTITATATDNVAVAGVTFRVDGTAVDAEDTAAPYSASFNTAILSNGSHSITAVARDTSNLTTTSPAVAVTVSNGGSSTGTEFVTSSTTLQVIQGNGFVGWAGMKFTTGSTPLIVTELGRMVLAGNSGNHTLKLVDGASGLDVSGASVTISLAGATVGQYRYGSLASAVTLSPNGAYYLVSSETLNADSTNYANVATTTAGVANNAVYSTGQNWVMEPGAKAYGPLNFKYTLASGNPDTTPPTVSITSPAAGQTLSGTVTITANATDNVGVAGVTFRVDGTAIGAEDPTAPYSASLNTATLSNGSHTITAVARDTWNLTTTSQGVPVTTSNASAPPIKVMPLGDSITYGWIGQGNPSNEDGGYRRYLWQMLSSTNNLDFVGTQQAGLVGIDRDHEGHPGFTITQISQNVDFWLTSTQPAIILLMIGTNDLKTDSASTALPRLEMLVDQILAKAPFSRLIVSSLVGVRQNTTETVTEQAVIQFNGGIPGIVSARANAGKNVSFVDTYSIAPLDKTANSADYGPDGLHPSSQGYSKIANAWYSVLAPLIPSR